MRTIDWIIKGFGSDYLKTQRADLERMGHDIPSDPFSQAIKLKIDNVAELFLRDKGEDWSYEDIQCPLPPWPITYSEWTAPDSAFPLIRKYEDRPVGIRKACLAFSRELTAQEIGTSPDARYVMSFVTFSFDEGAEQMNSSTILDADGEVCEHPELTAIAGFSEAHPS